MDGWTGGQTNTTFFNRSSTGFLMHTSFHAQFAVEGKQTLSGLVVPDYDDTRNLQNKLFLYWLSLIMTTLGIFKTNSFWTGCP